MRATTPTAVNSGIGTDIANPLYCNTHQTGYPCNSADDQAWSRIVVTQHVGYGRAVDPERAGRPADEHPGDEHAGLYLSALLSARLRKSASDCVAGMYWGNQNDGDYLDYYNGQFMGFAQTGVSNPDGSVVVHKYEATEGWGVYDTNQGISCAASDACHRSIRPATPSPWWHLANAGHGLEI